MLKGLKETASALKQYNIPFLIIQGSPPEKLFQYAENVKAGAVVTDFDPLRIKRKWKGELIQKFNKAIFEVDAHNIVPVWAASDKQEFAAYTIRPKIERALPEFLAEYPPVEKFASENMIYMEEIKWGNLLNDFSEEANRNTQDYFIPGEGAALRRLDEFLEHRLHNYAEQRNDPVLGGQSGLSPYLHFGQVSSQRIALNASRYVENLPSLEAFLEELIIRKELSDNYCFYNTNYDNFEGFPRWAKESLNKHREDNRPHTYSLKQFEDALTHDPLWNASQKEMILTGKMHGYMRMYWAKKILEWTPSPEDAIKTAIYLNDKYSLDGRDPNGYTGIAWSIGGVHDRPWQERGIFGQVRYMNYNGCRRKFDVDAYINKIDACINKTEPMKK